jgi:hypothetical protein
MLVLAKRGYWVCAASYSRYRRSGTSWLNARMSPFRDRKFSFPRPVTEY